MKQYKIERSILAKADFSDIWKYLYFYDENAANNFLIDISARISKLSDFPFMGAVHEELENDERFLVFKKYNIIYEVREETNTVFILRILHGSREIKNYL